MNVSMKKMIYDRLTGRETSLAVIGLGYVGVPVALRFARCFDVVGYDMDARRIEKLREKYGAGCGSIRFTSLEEELSRAAFYIVTVLTPVDERKNPDLTCLVEATRTVARYLKRGDYVVYESTVYPGCTEEVCVPLLEKGSGLKLGADFKVGYSPERINPNDSEHTFSNTAKIVSANDGQALDEVARVYAEVVAADLCRASGIRVAEAAKMTENVQRSVNIALMNELQRLFSRMGIDMGEVIDMASSKWKFRKVQTGTGRRTLHSGRSALSCIGRFKAGGRDARHEFGLRRERRHGGVRGAVAAWGHGKRRPRRKGFADGRHLQGKHRRHTQLPDRRDGRTAGA